LKKFSTSIAEGIYKMISVTEAKQIVENTVQVLPPQWLPLLQAAGKVLAEDVWAAIDIPAFEQSSMDGYAIRFPDKDLPLLIKGEMAAGTSQQHSINPGESVRIFTGAPLPAGADTVVMQEKVNVQGATLVIEDEGLRWGANVRPKGAEVKCGSLAVQKGTVLSPAALGFLAGIGVAKLFVFPMPSVSIIVTGNELQTPGKPLQPGQVYESNSFSLRAALQQAGIKNVTVLQAGDDPEELTTLLHTELARSDAVLLTGGLSVGDYDFVIEAARRSGVQQQFHKVRQRPGKPLYFGLKERVPVFGLPGNPASVLSCFYNYVLPALGKLSHKDLNLEVRQALLTADVATPKGLTQFLKGLCTGNEATPLGAQESFQLSSFAQANCLIQLAEERDHYSKGEAVGVLILPV
jgi:molybdopterin molybdotransferase